MASPDSPYLLFYHTETPANKPWLFDLGIMIRYSGDRVVLQRMALTVVSKLPSPKCKRGFGLRFFYDFSDVNNLTTTGELQLKLMLMGLIRAQFYVVHAVTLEVCGNDYIYLPESN